MIFPFSKNLIKHYIATLERKKIKERKLRGAVSNFRERLQYLMFNSQS